ncbi:zwei Ig domain protein zig-4-like [Brevipalpus obovatus]|uniref:zwei Ig domain protein zig-4-like n=1 Tax=Brevipalpus obovatus TaxID=246614 RepID=UPI003D9EBBDF
MLTFNSRSSKSPPGTESNRFIFRSIFLTLLVSLSTQSSIGRSGLNVTKRSYTNDYDESDIFYRVTKSKSSPASQQSKDRYLQIKEIAENVVAHISNDLALTCEARGSPPPEIHWMKDGIKIIQSLDQPTSGSELKIDEPLGLSSTTSKLYLDCISPEESGQYACVAKSTHSQVTAYTNVKVQSTSGKTRSNCKRLDEESSFGSRIYMWSRSRLELIGSSARLFCRASGIPRPQIEWFYEGNSLSSMPARFQILANGDLYIKSVEWKDMGNYVCWAKNEFGEDKVETFLYPTKPSSRK